MHFDEQKHNKHISGTISENVSLMSREQIVDKYQKKMKVRISELKPYVTEQFGFIDPDFHHGEGSITYLGQELNEEVSWVPAEQLSAQCSYSKQINSLDELSFCKKSIDFALMTINWFTKDIFLQIFALQISKTHLYEFDIMMDGVFVRMPIDSYVPVNSIKNQPLFAKAFRGSIFPCIFQKLLAKVYGDYHSITAQFIDIVEMITYFSREQISCTQGISEQTLLGIIQQKLSNDSIVCFRTRNSIRLQSFGLESNHVYIIMKVIQRQGDCLVQFLELQGSNWIGKYSKLRSNWTADLNQLANNNQLMLQEGQKENYMSLSDLKGISRELVVLNNTFTFHKNYEVCEKSTSCLTMYEFNVDKTNILQLRTNFRHKKCYNSILLIQLQNSKEGINIPTYKLVAMRFQQNKSSNYLQCQIQAGTYWIVIYNTHPQENILPYNLTIFSSYNFIQPKLSQNQLETFTVLEGAFHHYFANLYSESKEPLILKHLYETTGLAFIFVRPTQAAVQVCLQLQKFRSSKIFPLNIAQPEGGIYQQEFRQQRVLCFACQWSKKQNIDFEVLKVEESIQKKVVFPPMGSIKVKLRRQNSLYPKSTQ